MVHIDFQIGFGSDILLFLVIVVIVSLFFSIFNSYKKRGKILIEKPAPQTELVCKSCNFKEIRAYKPDDLLFKTVDEKCKNCGSVLKISGIFVEHPKKDKASE